MTSGNGYLVGFVVLIAGLIMVYFAFNPSYRYEISVCNNTTIVDSFDIEAHGGTGLPYPLANFSVIQHYPDPRTFCVEKSNSSIITVGAHRENDEIVCTFANNDPYYPPTTYSEIYPIIKNDSDDFNVSLVHYSGGALINDNIEYAVTINFAMTKTDCKMVKVNRTDVCAGETDCISKEFLSNCTVVDKSAKCGENSSMFSDCTQYLCQNKWYITKEG